MSETQMGEAPVSWTVRYITPEGFEAMLTLRGSDLKAVMATAKQAIEAMSKAGCRPHGVALGNGHGHDDEQSVPLCPTHHKPMKQSQHGGWYCPVKVAEDDGTGKPVYCKQKVKGGV